jgi:hypothetical protein
LLTWDGLHHAHGYVLYKSGIKYKELRGNGFVLAPDDSYQVYAKTWQGSEDANYPSSLAQLSYSLNLSYQYTNAVGAVVNKNTNVVGLYKVRQKPQLKKVNLVEIDGNMTTRTTIFISLSVLSAGTSQFTIKLKPRVRVVSFASDTKITNINLPDTNLILT